jgi:hypothetical protein
MLEQGLPVLEFCIDARGDCLLLCERRKNQRKIAEYSSIGLEQPAERRVPAPPELRNGSSVAARIAALIQRPWGPGEGERSSN